MTDDNIKAEGQSKGNVEGGGTWRVSVGVDQASLRQEQKEALKESRQFATKEEREQFLKSEEAK